MATHDPTLSVERLREVLSYDPDTGLFRWRITKGSRAPAGSVAGCRTPNGYLIIRVDRQLVMAHRIAWRMVHGYWPVRDIDHANGNRGDNRLENLRDATRSENNANQRGIRGVSFNKARRKFVGYVNKDGERHNLGCFDSKHDAAEAVAAKRAELFGEYAGTHDVPATTRPDT